MGWRFCQVFEKVVQDTWLWDGDGGDECSRGGGVLHRRLDKGFEGLYRRCLGHLWKEAIPLTDTQWEE